MYRYDTSGLPNVWLRNGYRTRKTANGEAVAIHDVEGLHAAIARVLVESKPHLTGPEFRFIRKNLDLSQARLADILGNDAQAVARWEKQGRVPKWADRYLRSVWRECKTGNAEILAIVEMLKDLDEKEAGKIVLARDGEWREAA
jgi:putative transcriptional regulator